MRFRMWVFLALLFLSRVQAFAAGQRMQALRDVVSVPQSFETQDSRTYSIDLEKGQFLRFVVEQRGIDVSVRIHTPGGRLLGEIDGPESLSGPEVVSVVAGESGRYRFQLDLQDGDEHLGTIVVQGLEVRPSTAQEWQTRRDPEWTKQKGLALMVEAADNSGQLRRLKARAELRLDAFRVLWPEQRDRARGIAAQAIRDAEDFVRQAIEADADASNRSGVQEAMELRGAVVDAIGEPEPEMALAFLRSTAIVSPNGAHYAPEECRLRVRMADAFARKDPRLAFQIAESTLTSWMSPGLTDTVQKIRVAAPELASQLSGQIAAKLAAESWLSSLETTHRALSFMQMVRQSKNPPARPLGVPKTEPLISEVAYRRLLEKMISEALSYSGAPAEGEHKLSAQAMLTALLTMSNEVQAYAPQYAAAIDEQRRRLNSPDAAPPASQMPEYFKYVESLRSESLDAGLDLMRQAPLPLRGQLYSFVAGRAADEGDSRVRGIVLERISDPVEAHQLLREFERRPIRAAISEGRWDDALNMIRNLRSMEERFDYMTRILDSLESRRKATVVVRLVDQMRDLMGAPSRAADKAHLSMLLSLSRAIAPYDSIRAFAWIDPIIEQFNDIATSALTLDGFGETYFEEGELIVSHDNAVGRIAEDLSETLATLALADFDRAKASADRFRLLEVRLYAYVKIAEQAIEGE